ncbi:hypothetical protein WICPIJ_005021 [Wickerhamomyces pijperi]|uniref:Uncharacterized protein n=1 Tax=Wickerhamomyces pijperi TaxID=599730 RepID=A0A9P8Q4C0_WICPI|nr:hypothetical protein WICPIJ_005021 [Wickerhamomyces pijperi]
MNYSWTQKQKAPRTPPALPLRVKVYNSAVDTLMEFSKGIKIDFDCIFTAIFNDFIESEEPSLRFEALQNRDIVLRGRINMAMNYYQTHQSLPPRRHSVNITVEDALIFRKTARLFAAYFETLGYSYVISKELPGKPFKLYTAHQRQPCDMIFFERHVVPSFLEDEPLPSLQCEFNFRHVLTGGRFPSVKCARFTTFFTYTDKNGAVLKRRGSIIIDDDVIVENSLQDGTRFLAKKYQDTLLNSSKVKDLPMEKANDLKSTGVFDDYLCLLCEYEIMFGKPALDPVRALNMARMMLESDRTQDLQADGLVSDVPKSGGSTSKELGETIRSQAYGYQDKIKRVNKNGKTVKR